MSLFEGLAAANAHPGAAQGAVVDVLSRVGVDIPNPNADAGTHSSGHGQCDSDTADTPDTGSTGKGSTISNIARTTDETGVAKGAAVSTAASDGKGHAGDHGQAGADSSRGQPADVPPVTTPNDGGTPTADIASGGASDSGTGTADSQSEGHSDEGSGNAVGGLANKAVTVPPAFRSSDGGRSAPHKPSAQTKRALSFLCLEQCSGKTFLAHRAGWLQEPEHCEWPTRRRTRRPTARSRV